MDFITKVVAGLSEARQESVVSVKLAMWGSAIIVTFVSQQNINSLIVPVEMTPEANKKTDKLGCRRVGFCNEREAANK